MKKIYIFSNFPEHCRDGMYQRIVEVDKILSANFELQYIKFSIFKNWRADTTIVHNRDVNLSRSVMRLNTLLYFFRRRQMDEECSAFYIHSVFNFLSAFPVAILSKKKIIFDMHGIVSEELRMEGSRSKANLFKVIEYIALYKSNIVLCVSNAMKDYIEINYRRNKESTILVVPTFEYEDVTEPLHKKIDKNSTQKIIYAGGNQVWQNIDIMRDTANNFGNLFTFEFYLPTVAAKNFLLGVSNKNVKVGTLSKSELKERYREVGMGFLLRDDNLVNRISSPTKMNEYFLNKIVPIVFSNCVGDMAHYNYEYILFEDIKNNLIPDHKLLDTMSENNFRRFKRQMSDARTNVQILVERLKMLCDN